MTERFTLPFHDRFLTSDADYANPDKTAAQPIQGRPLFVGGFRLIGLDSSATEDDFLALQNGSHWHLRWTGDALKVPIPITAQGRPLDVNPKAYYFWRFMTPDDLTRASANPRVDRTWIEFYRFITKEYFPPDLAIVSIHYEDCADAAAFELTQRYPLMKVAVLENLSNAPLRIGKSSWRQVQLGKLRSEDEDAEMINSVPIDEHNIFPAQLLAPHEKIAIPMRMVMAYESRDIGFLPGIGNKNQQAAANLSDSIELPVQVLSKDNYVSQNRFLTISGGALSAYAREPYVDPEISKVYVVGPSIDAVSVEVGGVSMSLRQFDPHTLILKGGSATGSCPYIFTYCSRDRRWRSEGPILYGFKNKAKEAWDRKALKNFDGRLLIREVDPETSWIDALRVDLSCGGGRTVSLLPRSETLRATDHKYLTLRRGESTFVAFDGEVPPVCQAVLNSYGYYVPSSDIAPSIRK
ncbi:MAG: hypothetical protein JO097_13330 [Acidobacteriaceae bacterium]|nr:hypothetical protein [Acidobacteriaceae bacterium]MBV9296334.1 hypothetical protein [Acidobacteriaceae bacterium]MBV9767100.1 hypothetical protein [Acidobacteriaceae bacterium]